MTQTRHALTMQLRAAFDASFAEGRAPEPAAHVDVLAIRVCNHGYAVRLSEVSAIQADRPIVPAPSPTPELLGLVGVRGQVVPVYDLRLLLGYARGPTPRWLALVRAALPFGVGFEQFESHLRLPLSSIVVSSEPGDTRPFVRGSIGTAEGPRPLIDLPAMVAGLTAGSYRDLAQRPSQHAQAPGREERR